MNEMGKRIYMMRTEKGWTMAELAEAIGVKASAINKYEKGIVQNIKRSTIKDMATIFGCSPAWLMGLEDETKLGLPNVSDQSVYKEVAELSNIYMHLNKEDQEYLLLTARRLVR